MKLKCDKTKEEEVSESLNVSDDLDDEETEVLSKMSVEYEPLGVNRRRNPNVSAEILGGFHTGGWSPGDPGGHQVRHRHPGRHHYAGGQLRQAANGVHHVEPPGEIVITCGPSMRTLSRLTTS